MWSVTCSPFIRPLRSVNGPGPVLVPDAVGGVPLLLVLRVRQFVEGDRGGRSPSSAREWGRRWGGRRGRAGGRTRGGIQRTDSSRGRGRRGLGHGGGSRGRRGRGGGLGRRA